MDFSTLHAQLTAAINRIRTHYGHLDAHQFAHHLVEEIKAWAKPVVAKVEAELEPAKPVDGKDLPPIIGVLNLTQAANSLV